jgi:hypothetical protein
MPGIDVWVTVAVGFDVWVISLLNGMVGYSIMAESKREREKQKSLRRRERETGEKNKVGPATVINWDPQKN